ncbi:MAG TPA: hypothetical protein VK808_01445, partial [Bacteroidia bacterium]|nr:hypothetical protein [Bacteroidia bacterium]
MRKQIAFLFCTFSFSFYTFIHAQNITTVVGNVVSGGISGGGYSGDGGPATAAELSAPYGVAFDAAGNMYIADDVNNVIREVDQSTGNISTVVGNTISGGAAGGGYSGDGGPATAAEIHGPACVVFDASGNMIIADADNHVVRKVDHSTGIITTIAGNHTNGYNGNGGAATAAELSYPTGIAFDAGGNLYIAEHGNNVIREVDNSNGIISTFAGNHISGYYGDGGPATAAEL